ncbi:MAG: ATP-dependent zinc metalloprotease FtsH [Bacillales bacterium]|nr:ATP-dependent zinc metalloprotease FtsH [Bacillales bacterium]
MKKNQKLSWLSYVLPYVLITGIIIAVVFIFRGTGTQKRNYSAGDIVCGYEGDGEFEENAKQSVLWTDNIVKLEIDYHNGNFIDVAGYVKEDSKNYAFSVRLSPSDYNESILNYIILNRAIDNGNGVELYYNSSNLNIIDPNASNFWSDFFPVILTGVLVIGAVIFMVSRMSASVSKSNNQAMDFNKSRARREDNSKVKFDDVAGCDEEKEEMREMVDYLKNPQKYASAGAKLPKGVLLVGPPGTGKTLLAKAVAGEAKVPFYSISGSDFVEMFVGVGAGRVRDMFKKAKATAPCLVFIDEIDAVGRQRGAGLGGGNDEREQTLNQLLVEMDGFADNVGIIVMAATNRADVLDPALMRAGRFDRQITVGLPDKVGREEILKVHARGKKFDSSVDWKNIAKRTVGFSGADLASIINDAAILSVRLKKEKISIKEIDEAIDRRIAGPAKKSKRLNELERKTVAYHEAGHAIIGILLPESDKVQKVTIIPRGMAGGYVLSAPEDDRFLMTKGELIAEITGILGGRASEEVFFNDISTGASNDIEKATKIARAMVVEYGMSSLGPIQYETAGGSVFLGRDYTSSQKNFSGQVANEIDREVRNIIETAHQNAIDLIKTNRDKVVLIAEALLENETINAEEIDYLLKNGKMPVYSDAVEVVEEPKDENGLENNVINEEQIVVTTEEFNEDKKED